MDHSFEEIRRTTLDILAGREAVTYDATQYQSLQRGVAQVFARRETGKPIGEGFGPYHSEPYLSEMERDIFQELFWDLFRQGIITLGLNDSNPNYPFLHVSAYGRKILANQHVYFYHDVASYEKVIQENVPNIDDVTLVYLKEAMQTFTSDCLLSATVMLGVATEHTFLKLLDTVEANPKHGSTYANVFLEKTILQKFNKFRNILGQHERDLPGDIKENWETDFAGILTMIRNFRNDSGHPTGKRIGREQSYVLLNLFIPCCKKMYQLIEYFCCPSPAHAKQRRPILGRLFVFQVLMEAGQSREETKTRWKPWQPHGASSSFRDRRKCPHILR